MFQKNKLLPPSRLLLRWWQHVHVCSVIIAVQVTGLITSTHQITDNKCENKMKHEVGTEEVQESTVMQLVKTLSCAITKNSCVLHNTVEHNYISSSSTLGLQLHVSALYVGHLQVVT